MGVLCRCGGFWWYWWFDFYGLKLFLSGTYWFHLCIQLCSCWLGISNARFISVFWASGIGSFGCMSKELMVFVPLKKLFTLYFVRIHLYCSPMLWYMVWQLWFLLGTFLWMGMAFWWVSLVERTVLGSGCLVGLYEGDSFLLQEIQVYNIIVQLCWWGYA